MAAAGGRVSVDASRFADRGAGLASFFDTLGFADEVLFGLIVSELRRASVATGTWSLQRRPSEGQPTSTLVAEPSAATGLVLRDVVDPVLVHRLQLLVVAGSGR